MPKIVFISAGPKSPQAERRVAPALKFAKTLVETLNQKQPKSAYLIQNIYDENAIYQLIDDHALISEHKLKFTDTQPTLHLLLDSEREGCCFTPEKLQQFKYRGGKITVTVWNFEKHRFDSYKLQTLSYINLADEVIFSEKQDKEAAAKAALHYYPSEKRLKHLIDVGAVFPAFPPIAYLALQKPMERGRDIIFQGEIRPGTGLAHVRNLAENIAKSTSIHVKDKMIHILGSVSDETQYNRVLKDLMHALYPAKAAELQNKSAGELKKLLLEYQSAGIKPVLPIELYLNLPLEAYPALFDKISYCFLPYHGGARLKDVNFTQALDQLWITYSHQGYETPDSLKPEGALSKTLILRENDEYSTYASGVLSDIEHREQNLHLNQELFERLQKLAHEKPTPSSVLDHYLQFYGAFNHAGNPSLNLQGTLNLKNNFNSLDASHTSSLEASLEAIQSESMPPLIHSFRSWRDMPLPKKYATLQETRSHAQLQKIKGIPLFAKSEANYKALLKRLKELTGPYSEEMRKFLSEHKGNTVLTLEERRFIKTLLSGPWKLKHVTKDVKIIAEKGNQLLALEERRRRTESTKNSNTPADEGHTNNVFMSFGPGDIETVRFLDDVPHVIESNFKHLLGDETPKNIEPDPYALHGFWSSDHFYAYGAEQIGDPVIIYGTRYQVNYRKTIDESNNTTRYYKECNFTAKDGQTMTQTMELGDEIFMHPRLDIALLLLTVEKIRFLGKNAWSQIMQETDPKVLQGIVQTFYHTGVLEVHKPEQFLIDQPGVELNWRQPKTGDNGKNAINRDPAALEILKATLLGEREKVLKALDEGLSLNKPIACPYQTPYHSQEFHLPLLAAAILGGQLELVQIFLNRGLDFYIPLSYELPNEAPLSDTWIHNYIQCTLVATDPTRLQAFLKRFLGESNETAKTLDTKQIAERAFQILKLCFDRGASSVQNKQIQHLLEVPNAWNFENILCNLRPKSEVLNYLLKISNIPAKQLPLAWTAYLETRENVVEMLRRGADVNQRLISTDRITKFTDLKLGYTALFVAISKKDRQLMEILLKEGAEVNVSCHQLSGHNASDGGRLFPSTLKVEDPEGYTPLMLAVEQNYREGVELLLQHKANVTVRSASGKTAISIARKLDSKEILDLLLATLKGAKEPPLATKALKAAWDEVQAEFRAGVDDLAMNEQGQSAYDLCPALLDCPAIPVQRQAERYKLFDHKVFVIPVGRLPSGEKFIVLNATITLGYRASFLPFMVEDLINFSEKNFIRHLADNAELKLRPNKITWQELGQASLGIEEAGVHDASKFIFCDLGEYSETELSIIDPEECRIMKESTFRQLHKDSTSVHKEYPGFFFSGLTMMLINAVMPEKGPTPVLPLLSTALSVTYSKALTAQYQLLNYAKTGEIKGIDELLRSGVTPNYSTPTLEADVISKKISYYTPYNDSDRISPFLMALSHEKWDAALFLLEQGQFKAVNIYNFLDKIVAAGQIKLFQALRRLECWDTLHNLGNFLETAFSNSQFEMADYIHKLIKEDSDQSNIIKIDFYEKLKNAASNLIPSGVKYLIALWQKEKDKSDNRTLKEILDAALRYAPDTFADNKDSKTRTMDERAQAFMEIMDMLLPSLDNKDSDIYYSVVEFAICRDLPILFQRMIAFRGKETYPILNHMIDNASFSYYSSHKYCPSHNCQYKSLLYAIQNNMTKVLHEVLSHWLKTDGTSEFSLFMEFCKKRGVYNNNNFSVDIQSIIAKEKSEIEELLARLKRISATTERVQTANLNSSAATSASITADAVPVLRFSQDPVSSLSALTLTASTDNGNNVCVIG